MSPARTIGMAAFFTLAGLMCVALVLGIGAALQSTMQAIEFLLGAA